MKIENLRIDEIEDTKAALFTVDGVECIEWISLSFDETHYIPERTDSHMRSYCNSDHDVDEILDALAEALDSFGLGE
jgi:hypothetical protein